jgi:hypothetical protein
MALLEDRTAVFIVRVWCERGDAESSTNPMLSEWRGSVEHVQSGQRIFFRHLDAVCEFMKPHLEGIGIDAQQRFWERISSVIDDVSTARDSESMSVTVPLIPPQPAASQRARKRR